MRHPLQHRTWRWVLLTALVVELVAIAYLVFNPSPAVPSSAVQSLSYRLDNLGLPSLLTAPSVIEFLLNVALFIPLGATLALLVPKVAWWLWALFGFLASAAVEGLQLMLLSERTATVRDIAANTTGLAVGALLAKRLMAGVASVDGRSSRRRESPLSSRS